MRSKAPMGQTIVELALVLPLFLMVVVGIVVLGIGVFYQQQVTNAAREAARYAAIHSATSQCPAASHLPPMPTTLTADKVEDYLVCDSPANNWPDTHQAARDAVFGMNKGVLRVSACWSGYVDTAGNYDASATDPLTGADNTFVECTMRSGGLAVNPRSDSGSLPCPPEPTVGSATAPPGTDGDDKASSLATSTGFTTNQVTVYACYTWAPPMAGFLLIPPSVTFRAVLTEAIQHQR